MIEAVTSKVVGGIAVLALLGSVLGFFAVQNGALEEARFREMCDSLARAIDSSSSVNARFLLNFTFNDSCPGKRLEPLFRGRAYDIEIYTGAVFMRQEGLVASSSLITSVHPWDPALLGATSLVSGNSLSLLDAQNPCLKTQSGRGFVLERVPIGVGGECSYMTFLHT
ncbi:MAG: hypothetical protein QW379_00130 [Thermoplasmata archaeon]